MRAPMGIEPASHTEPLFHLTCYIGLATEKCLFSMKNSRMLLILFICAYINNV